MESPDGLTMALSGTAVGAVCGLVGAWIKARYGGGSLDRVIKENENDHRNLFARLSKVEKDVASVRTETRGIGNRLDRIENKIDRLIERAIQK